MRPKFLKTNDGELHEIARAERHTLSALYWRTRNLRDRFLRYLRRTRGVDFESKLYDKLDELEEWLLKEHGKSRR